MISGHREEDLAVEELNCTPDLLSDAAHETVEKTH